MPDNRRWNKILKEIHESMIISEYIEANGLDFEDPILFKNDSALVRAAKQWKELDGTI